MNRIKAVIFATLLALAGDLASSGQEKKNCRPAGDGCNTICENSNGTGGTITTAYCGPLSGVSYKWSDFALLRAATEEELKTYSIGWMLRKSPSKSEASALCGSHGETTAAEYYVSCVDFDRLRELTGAPAFGKQTQVFVDAKNQDVVAVRVTAKRGEETRTHLAEPFKQPHGRRVAVAIFEGLDWETVTVQVLIEEK